jgi:hypothetical protein
MDRDIDGRLSQIFEEIPELNRSKNKLKIAYRRLIRSRRPPSGKSLDVFSLYYGLSGEDFVPTSEIGVRLNVKDVFAHKNRVAHRLREVIRNAH